MKTLQEKTKNNTSKTIDHSYGAIWHKPVSITKQNGSLTGISFGAKDLFAVENLPLTAGSKILKDFVAPYTSTVIDRTLDTGATLTAQLAMDEFAMGSFTNTSHYGKTLNPIDKERTAGGSSGGSACAVARDFVDFAWGSDTGGSVRQPASFCGLYGFKPTYGSFSRYGMISYASSLDQSGLVTHHLDDLKFILDNMDLTKDNKDPTSTGFAQNIITNESVGYFPELLESDAISDSVKSQYKKLVLAYGERATPIHIPLMRYSAEIYYIIACAEAASNLARYQGIYYGNGNTGSFQEAIREFRTENFGTEVKRRILIGNHILSSENYEARYMKARKLRDNLRSQINDVFAKVGIIILPTTVDIAPKWDEISTMTAEEIYMADMLTTTWSLAGNPVISVPYGTCGLGMPIGMQYVSKHGTDLDLLSKI